MDFPEIKWRPKDDEEFNAIKSVDYMEFLHYMEDKDLKNLRLPINNPDAYQYLRWLNQYFMDDNNHLNYLLNIWDAQFSEKKIRPPTTREVAIFSAHRIIELDNDKDIKPEDKKTYIDFNAEFIRDAYQYWCYPIWISSGLAGCVLKWGTFEDNAKSEEDYITWEEWNK